LLVLRADHRLRLSETARAGGIAVATPYGDQVKATIIEIDDWAGLYVDGDLIFEGHRVGGRDLAHGGVCDYRFVDDEESFVARVEASGMPKTLADAQELLGQG
jgi:hypothetical protein